MASEASLDQVADSGPSPPASSTTTADDDFFTVPSGESRSTVLVTEAPQPPSPRQEAVNANHQLRREKQGSITFEPTTGGGTLFGFFAPPTTPASEHHHAQFGGAENVHLPPHQPELMGPILRRKRVVSMPLGGVGSSDFFGPQSSMMPGGAHPASRHVRKQKQKSEGVEGMMMHDRRHPMERQLTPPHHAQPPRTRQGSLVKNMLRRKQVGLDLLAPDEFFYVPDEQKEHLISQISEEKIEEEGDEDDEETDPVPSSIRALFRPLRFAPRVLPRGQPGGGGGHHAAPPPAPVQDPTTASLSTIDEETQSALLRFSSHVEILTSLVSSSVSTSPSTSQRDEQVAAKVSELQADDQLLQKKLRHLMSTAGMTMSSSSNSAITSDKKVVKTVDEDEELLDDEDDDISYGGGPHIDIIRATRRDKIIWGIVTLLMVAITLVVSLWETHLDDDSFILQPIGLACVTDCPGNIETRDFFGGHNHFETNQVIDLLLHLDPHPDGDETTVLAEIVGTETGHVKATYDFGHPELEERISLSHEILVDFDHPHEPHVVNVYSTNNATAIEVSFTLKAKTLSPLADYSVLVAALIMVMVYFFILIEVIHRTLVAIFGSMVALMFFFIMEGGETESIRIIMLHLEWSTLGLLFGMMLIVGELSHTGIFEWFAVRILILSKGSFHRLIVLLCVLTAVASAFLDNVTTMLLIAPVTIDMCNILDVDPRPYLISEVLLSNIGGTATLIGDPPNIIIGSAFADIIGFVDFITNVLPCIFIFCLPVSLVLVMWIYRYYLTTTKMRVLDVAKLKKAYPVYDEPRLLIAGTVTFFVIVMFFLHPVHHKDTAWVALLGAFVTIAFTNPHDVQDALRNHVEWDTLLFFAGLFVLVEVCAAMGLLDAIGSALATYIEGQPEDKQLTIAITLIIWVSAIVSAFLDNIPYTATMIPVIEILAKTLPDTLPLETLAWALSFGACLGGNGTLLGASANIVTAGIATNRGFEISFLNFLYPGMLSMFVTVAIANVYMLVRYSWI